MEPKRVILLPGAVLPAEPAYGELIKALGPDVNAVAKDLELYSGDAPPPGWTLDTEIDGILREADARRWNTFHLLGYSGGGAVALAFTAKHPDSVQSLALLEPAWAGSWDWSPEHTQLWEEYDELDLLQPDEFMTAFMRMGVKPDVVLPPPLPGDPPPWMGKRPAGIRAFMQTFKDYALERDKLASFPRPVFLALGGLSNPVDYGEVAERLSKVFRDFRLEVFEERHHFDPPHRIEPERLAGLLRAHWEGAERRARLG